jgi:hypothetical protein
MVIPQPGRTPAVEPAAPNLATCKEWTAVSVHFSHACFVQSRTISHLPLAMDDPVREVRIGRTWQPMLSSAPPLRPTTDQLFEAPCAQARDSAAIGTDSPTSTTGTTLTSFQKLYFETNVTMPWGRWLRPERNLHYRQDWKRTHGPSSRPPASICRTRSSALASPQNFAS